MLTLHAPVPVGMLAGEGVGAFSDARASKHAMRFMLSSMREHSLNCCCTSAAKDGAAFNSK